MIKATQIKRAGLLLGLAWFAACSGETDRRDELGLEDGGDERYELVELEEGDEERATSVDSSSQKSVETESGDMLYDPESQSVAEVPLLAGDQPVIFYPRGRYTVQIGGYRNAAKARALVRQLNDAGYPTYAIARRGSEEMRVRIGYFKTRGDADRFGTLFQADHNMEYWVDKRENE